MGYLMVLWSLFSYGTLGICHKLAERKHCRPRVLAMIVMLSAFLGMNIFVVFGKRGYTMPSSAFYVAITCGSVALCALWAFQEGIKRGKIATSWLIINLSSVIPTLGSIVIYHEPINLKKMVVVGLIFVAIVLVWRDGLEDLRKLEEERKSKSVLPPSTKAGEIAIEREM
jgi:EamA domain-containing membrane protein RarD